jgi:hypothetical protein
VEAAAVRPLGQVRPPTLPCLAPIRFVSVSGGGDGSDARFDLPWFTGGAGVAAATLGTRPPTESGRTRAVVVSVSSDGGRSWTVPSARRIASCLLDGYYTASWPASIVDERVWWIVAGGSRPVAQVTTDAGQTWHTTLIRGLLGR